MIQKKTLIIIFLVLISQLHAQNKISVPSKKIYLAAGNSVSDTTKVFALLKLADYHIEQSNKIAMPKSIDSAFYYAQKAEKISDGLRFNTGSGKSFIRLSRIAHIKTQPKTAQQQAEKAIAILKSTSDKTDLGDAYMALYNSDSSNREIMESLAMAQKAAAYYAEDKNIRKQADAVAEQGQCTAISGKINEGIELYKKAIALNEQAGKKNNQMFYGWIAIFYDAQGQYKPAMENILKAVGLVEQYNDNSADAVQVYMFAWAVHHHINDKSKEIIYLKKAHALTKLYNDYGNTIEIEYFIFRYYQEAHNTSAMKAIMPDLEKTYTKLTPRGKIKYISNLIRAYTALENFPKAEQYAQIGMKFSASLPLDDDKQEAIYKGLVGYLYKSKQYELSRKYAKAYLKFNEKYKNPLIDTDMHQFLFKIDSVQGNYQSSLENYKKAMQLKGTLLDSEKNKQIAELQIKYETDKKDKNLQLLKKQGELQKSRLEKSNLLRNIAFGGVAIFLILIVLLYLRYREKQRMNNILGIQKNEINQKNGTLEKLVKEKEWLLKEIHHRAKNNLQMVMNLLNTQSHYLKDGAAVEAITESKNRILAMSLIHKKLYQSDELQSINMVVYIKELIENFKDSYVTSKNIRFTLEIEPLELITDEAVPLGLIINEIITNSIKHAFPDNEGHITIILKSLNQSRIILSIKDNGTGIAGSINYESYTSMGMKLIKGLSDDLCGNLVIQNDNGLLITLEFKSNRKLLETIQTA